MEGSQRIKDRLTRIIKTATGLFIPNESQTESARFAGGQRPAQFLERLDWTRRSTAELVRRVLFPAISIDISSQPLDGKVEVLAASCEGLRRSTVVFLLSILIYTGVEVPLLPPSELLPPALPIIVAITLIWALRLWRVGLAVGFPGKPRVEIHPLDKRGYLIRLKNLLSSIPVGSFSPSTAPMRSGGIALTALLMLFAPSYPTVRWVNGYPLPAEVSWLQISYTFLLALILFAWFGWIWKAGKLATEAIRREIKALDAELSMKTLNG